MRKINTLYCDFCEKNQHEVFRLITGGRSFICNECIEECVKQCDWSVVKPENQVWDVG